MPPQGGALAPDVARRVEVLIRSRSSVPANYVINVGAVTPGEIPGYRDLAVTFSNNGKSSKPVHFLLSNDNKTLAQFSKFDISQDPKELVSAAGRPARGGPADAPVVIVGFDDLECPFCARMHAELFPAVLERYKDQVRIVYKDFPLDIHPWAMRAAVDANCLGSQSAGAYWKMVDEVHLHASELGGEDKSLAKANVALDAIARDQGKAAKVDETALNACLAKQDQTTVQAGIKDAERLELGSTPVLFINGEKLEGAYPVTDVFRMIDEALIAQGKTPPPAAPASPGAANPQGKPGA